MDTTYINPTGNYSNSIDIDRIVHYSLSTWRKPEETVTPAPSFDYKKMSAVNAFFPKKKSNIFFPLKTNTDFLLGFQEQIFFQDKDLSQKIARLIDNIGIRLYKKLTQEQIMLMLRTAGIIEFNKPVDITSLYGYIKTYES